MTKKICLLHLISQEPYIIWLWFMLHLCKMMSLAFFFVFFYCKSISEWIFEKFHFVTTWGFSKKNMSNFDFSHNSAQHEKLSTFIVCYITNHQNYRISKLAPLNPTYKIRDVFLKTPLFGKTWNVISIWLGSTISHTVDCLLNISYRHNWEVRNREPKPAAVLKFHCYLRVIYNFYQNLKIL